VAVGIGIEHSNGDSDGGFTWTTGQPLSESATLNGTNQVMTYTNNSSSALNSARKIALTRLANTHTNSVTVTVWVSRPNN
jgi:hypothetical protein